MNYILLLIIFLFSCTPIRYNHWEVGMNEEEFKVRANHQIISTYNSKDTTIYKVFEGKDVSDTLLSYHTYIFINSKLNKVSLMQQNDQNIKNYFEEIDTRLEDERDESERDYQELDEENEDDGKQGYP